MTTTLLSCPQELLVDIMLKAGPRGILKCQITCRTLRDIVKDSTKLQYFVELFAACKLDNPKRNVSYIHALDTLLQCEKSWSQLRWRASVDSVEIPFNVGDIDLSCGTFVACNLPARSDFEWHQYTFDPMDPTIERVCLDASRDLLVTIKPIVNLPLQHKIFDLGLWSLTTLTPYPMAVARTIRLEILRDEILDMHSMLLAGDHIGIVFGARSFASDEFILIDWKTGVRKESRLSFPTQRIWEDFAFLSDTAVLLPNSSSKSPNCTLDLYTFSAAPDSLRLVASLGLPPTQPSCITGCSEVITSGDAQVVGDGAADSSRDGESNRGDPRETIVALILHFEHPGLHSQAYFLITPKATLLSQLLDLMKNTIRGDFVFVPWHKWGPHRTALLPAGCPEDVLYQVSGTRFAIMTRASGPTDDEDNESDDEDCDACMEIYDFNRFRVRRQACDDAGMSSIGPTDDSVGFVHDTSVVPGLGIFPEPPLAALAYRKISRHMNVQWTQFLMDNHRIVGLDHGNNKLDVLFF